MSNTGSETVVSEVDLFCHNLRKDCGLTNKERRIRSALIKSNNENKKLKSEVAMYKVLLGLSIAIVIIVAIAGSAS